MLTLASMLFAVTHACATDIDCSLNGICSSGVCVCDLPWGGSSCEHLKRGQATPVGAYGYKPNVTSWGGNSLLINDTYHLYVAEIDGGLSNWGHASECVHAVSKNIEGPYDKSDVALPAECHNPNTIVAKDGNLLMFHIGKGGYMHYAPSPQGPWTPAENSPGWCNNPAPAYHPNGTLFLICSHSKITSATDYRSNWTEQRNLWHNINKTEEWNLEDPFLWFDRRQNFHIVYHNYCKDAYAPGKVCYSAHLYSKDGIDWHLSQVEPYNGTVQYTDGSSFSFATRERPHMMFAVNDTNRTTPIGFFTGVSPQPEGPQCNTCRHGDCSSCKVTQGRDWTYTLYEPFVSS